jgi:aryl-alcohol dehydrogenase-like predicted oxidoreductase
MTIPGRATPEATTAYAQAHPQLAYNWVNDTGLLVSQAGFGTYRVEIGVGEHAEALGAALLGGVNLIDTSANYGDGAAEELVGAVMTDLAHSRQLTREAVVVVSKAGYLQGRNFARSQQRKAAGSPYPDLVELGRGLEHCIHPEALADGLSGSLERLELATLDYFLLHNPEYYLDWAQKVGEPLDEARQEYYRRIELAFRYLEEEVGRGRIQGYGVSSNTFGYPADHAQHTSLERLWQLAEGLGEHHFHLIQLPLNLFEPGAATEPNGPNGASVLELARQKRLGVLVNRPLNAIVGGRVRRLADPPPMAEVTGEGVTSLIETLLAEEETFRLRVLPALELDAEVARQLADYLSAGQALRRHWPTFAGYAHWREIQGGHLTPRAQAAISFLANRSDLAPEAVYWVDRYVKTINAVFTALSAFYGAKEREANDGLRRRIMAVESEWAAPSLSQMACRALRTTAGVTSVLVGMRQRAYVADILAELQRPATIRERREAWARLPG